MFFLIFVGVVILCYFLKPVLKKGIVWIIKTYAEIPKKGFDPAIFNAFMRVLKLNWYNYVLLLLVWLLLFFTEVGKDIIDAYLGNLKNLDFGWTIGSLLSLFFCIFIMSLSIWILPFFMYSPEKEKEILENYKRFYLSSKIIAFIAMFPFLLITNAFLFFSLNTYEKLWLILLINGGSFILFLGLIYLFTIKMPFNFLKKADRLSRNPYIVILIKITILVVMLALLFAGIMLLAENKDFKNLDYLSYLVAFYIFIASAFVFRLLFYSNESHVNVRDLVEKMLTNKNKKHSRVLYNLIVWLLVGIVLYYYFVPSLEATNPLYILLFVFSFYVIYFDYWRHSFSNRRGFKKVFAFFAMLLFPLLQFIPSPARQFTVPFKDAPAEAASINLDSAALKQRVNYILQNSPDTGNLFIICAMGGGSRAGYIAAAVLKAIDDSISSNLYNHTICYSTVSGGSVGVYNYIVGRDSGELESDSDYLRNIYQKNYNSSGVYGLLIGDALETLFGNILTKPHGWLLGDKADFYDRNYRIRKEYDYILANELSGKKLKDNYPNKTFYPFINKKPVPSILFKDYYIKHGGSVPIHLINTFEVNSGRRTVLSPFPTRGKTFFSNSITPLQDLAFDTAISKKDISYRDAVNLSELFPLISAASHIGIRRDAQFVDGGYYENYGLATALDVFYYLRDVMHISSKRLKILLIKNSRQNPADSGHALQLVAPLVGVMEAPFTGHANNLVFETLRALDEHNFDTIVFDAKLKDVPLTRGLTKRHIDSMELFVDSISHDPNFKNRLNRFINDTVQIQKE